MYFRAIARDIYSRGFIRYPSWRSKLAKISQIHVSRVIDECIREATMLKQRRGK
jgi:hypothetical protein